MCTVPKMPAAEARTASLAARRHDLNARLRADGDAHFRCADVAAAFEDRDGGAYDADGLHLTKASYADLGRAVYPALRAAMKQKKTAARAEAVS